MSDSHRKRTTRKRMTSWNRHSTAALVVVNLAALAMYVLWQIADSWAVERAEAGGFDTTMLLPHSVVMWCVAHLMILAVVVLDVHVFWTHRHSRPIPRGRHVAILGVLAASALAMYVLWQIADSWAVERAEAGGFDTTMLLPHHMVAWVVVHVLVASVLALAALAWPRHPRRDRPRRETPAPAPDPARTSG